MIKKSLVLFFSIFLLSGCSNEQATYSNYLNNLLSPKSIKVSSTPTALNSDTKVYQYDTDSKKYVKSTIDETGKMIDQLVCESDVLHYNNMDGFDYTGACVTSNVDATFIDDEAKLVSRYNDYLTVQKITDDSVVYKTYTLENGIQVTFSPSSIKFNNSQIEIAISANNKDIKTSEFK